MAPLQYLKLCQWMLFSINPRDTQLFLYYCSFVSSLSLSYCTARTSVLKDHLIWQL